MAPHPFKMGDTVKCIQNLNIYEKANVTIGNLYTVTDTFWMLNQNCDEIPVITVDCDLGPPQHIVAEWFELHEIDYLQISKEICGKL